MKNITLALDENVLAAVRRHAANRGATVNAIARDHLARRLGSTADQFCAKNTP